MIYLFLKDHKKNSDLDENESSYNCWNKNISTTQHDIGTT